MLTIGICDDRPLCRNTITGDQAKDETGARPRFNCGRPLPRLSVLGGSSSKATVLDFALMVKVINSEECS